MSNTESSVAYLLVYIVHHGSCVLVSALHLISIAALGALRVQPLLTRLLPTFVFTLAIFMHNLGPTIFGSVELAHLVNGHPESTLMHTLKEFYFMAIAYPLLVIAIFSVLFYSLRYFVIKMQLQYEKTRYYESMFRRGDSTLNSIGSATLSETPRASPSPIPADASIPGDNVQSAATIDTDPQQRDNDLEQQQQQQREQHEAETLIDPTHSEITMDTAAAPEEPGTAALDTTLAGNMQLQSVIGSSIDPTLAQMKRIRVLRALSSRSAMICMILACEALYVALTILVILLEYVFHGIETGAAFLLVTNIFSICCVLLGLGVVAMFLIDFVLHVPRFLKSKHRFSYAKNYFLDDPYYWRAELSVMLALGIVAVVFIVGAVCRSCYDPISQEIIMWILTTLWLLYPCGVPISVVSWINFIRARRRAESLRLVNSQVDSSTNEIEELLKRILADNSRKYRVFENYCMREFSQENPWCYREVQRLQRIKSRTRYVQQLRNIVHAYIVKRSPLQVNLPHEVRASTINMLNDLELQQVATNSPMVLSDEHLSTISKLQRCLLANCYDTFTRFALQPEYKKL